MIVKILLLFRMNGKKLVVVTVEVLCCNWILEANSIQLLKMASLCSFFLSEKYQMLTLLYKDDSARIYHSSI